MVNSGSSAIHLALKILNFKKDSEVIVPCLNFGTAISSLLFCNLKPILVDVNINTLQINENLIEKNKFKNKSDNDSKFNWKHTKLAIYKKNC